VTLADRTVLLTGATGGLGAEMARALTAQGASLVLTGRRADALEAIAAETGGRPVLADLAEPGAAEALVREAGRVDVLIANAALPAVRAVPAARAFLPVRAASRRSARLRG